jgi:hypothetical protein
MRRSTVIPLVGVVLALVVVLFIFFASRPDPDADVVGDGGGLEEVVRTGNAGAPAEGATSD